MVSPSTCFSAVLLSKWNEATRTEVTVQIENTFSRKVCHSWLDDFWRMDCGFRFVCETTTHRSHPTTKRKLLDDAVVVNGLYCVLFVSDEIKGNSCVWLLVVVHFDCHLHPPAAATLQNLWYIYFCVKYVGRQEEQEVFVWYWLLVLSVCCCSSSSIFILL